MRNEILPEANGQQAIDELAARRAENEKQAGIDHAKRLQEIGSPLATAASKAVGLENPAKSQEAVVFEEPSVEDTTVEGNQDAEVIDISQGRHDEQFHVPDVEPTVSKVEDEEKIPA